MKTISIILLLLQALQLWKDSSLGDMPIAPKHPRDPMRLLPNPPAEVGLFAQWEAKVVQMMTNGGTES